ncbi:MAG TPA: N-acetyltransferase [Arcobacter sp.]|jgi:predicted GNAT family acetyltransferase|nr:N-acetyltransferase [Arcobacter sp.]
MEHNYKLIHNEAESQYEYHIEGMLARLVYDNQDGVLHLTHTFVPKELGGRGIAGALVKDVFEDIKKRGLKMKPACSYIVNYVEKYPEYEKLQ